MIDPEFLSRVWSALVSRLVHFFPTILATLTLLVLGVLLSWVLGALAGRLSRRLGLDRQVKDSGLEDSLSRAGLARPPSALMARLVFWLVFLCFVIIALQNVGLDLSQLPIKSFVAYVPQLIGAVILLILGVLIATVLGNATDVGLAGMGVGFHRRLGVIVRWVLIALVVIATVDQLGFDVKLLTDTFTNLVTILAAGLALAFAWGGREVARNVLAGYYVKESFRAGDRIVVDGMEGRLEAIGALNSRMRTAGGGEAVVPNSRLVEQSIEKQPPAGDSAD